MADVERTCLRARGRARRGAVLGLLLVASTAWGPPNDEEGFLAAIRAAPYDDKQAEIYADWLEERGEADRSEIIRVQVELWRLGPTGPRREMLEAREKELIEKHAGDWYPHGVKPKFINGILVEAEVPFAVFLIRDNNRTMKELLQKAPCLRFLVATFERGNIAMAITVPPGSTHEDLHRRYLGGELAAGAMESPVIMRSLIESWRHYRLPGQTFMCQHVWARMRPRDEGNVNTSAGGGYSVAP